MPAVPLYALTIEEAAAGLAAGEFSSMELTQACLDRIDRWEPHLNAFIRVEKEAALQQAAESDRRRQAGKSLGPLDGIPYALKDVYATKDSPTTAGSHILKDWTAPYDATVYSRLKAAGAVLLGKANTDEFTMGGSTETSYYGVSRNPWDWERVSGGSSGGSAAAVAAGFGLFSVGTDTGGSVRQPAAFCGVTGLRPTYGRISRFGELAMASSLDQTGLLTRTARDAALLLRVLAGLDPLDATSSPEPVPDYLAVTQGTDLKGVRIGVPAEYFGSGLDPDVVKTVREAIAELEKAGAELKELSLPKVPYSLAAYYIICPAEISSNMARYDGIRYGHSVEREATKTAGELYEVYAKTREAGFGAEVKRRIMLGTHVLSAGYYEAYYGQAERARSAIVKEFAEAFAEVDLLAGPVAPSTAFKIGEKASDPLAMYMEDILTVPVNVGGVAGISLPCGLADGLPVGLQLIAGRFQEEKLLRAAAVYQARTSHHRQRPPLLAEKEHS